MRAEDILDQHLPQTLGLLDKRLARTLKQVVLAMMQTGGGTLNALGSQLGRPNVLPKHRIKCVDRFLSNRRVHRVCKALYREHIQRVLGTCPRPVIVVDWTQTTPTDWVLSASRVRQGRSVPLYQTVHRIRSGKNARAETRFLNQLSQWIPSCCTPVVVTDAGFRNPWFRKVRDLGWDFMGRLGQSVHLKTHPDRPFAAAHTWFAQADSTPKRWTQCTVAQSNPLSGAILLYQADCQHRQGSTRTNRKGMHPRCAHMQKCRKRAHDPWVVFTSLTQLAADELLQLYQHRMQCEQTFRDFKSHRFGLGFEDLRTRSRARLHLLWALGMLAISVNTLLGSTAESLRLQTQFQANSIKHRRVLSLPWLGRLVYNEPSVRLRVLDSVKRAWLARLTLPNHSFFSFLAPP